jgi:imidazolonepropionase-like amidohydrolase
MCRFQLGKNARRQATVSVLSAMRDAGIPSHDLISATTTNAIAQLRRHYRVGDIAPGKYADLVAFAGNPVEGVGGLECVRYVIRDGHVVWNDLALN